MDYQLERQKEVKELEEKFNIKILSYHDNIAICEELEGSKKLSFIAVFKDGELNKKYYHSMDRLTKVYNIYLTTNRFETALFKKTGLKIKAKRDSDVMGDSVVCSESDHKFTPFVLDSDTFRSMNNYRLFD